MRNAVSNLSGIPCTARRFRVPVYYLNEIVSILATFMRTRLRINRILTTLLLSALAIAQATSGLVVQASSKSDHMDSNHREATSGASKVPPDLRETIDNARARNFSETVIVQFKTDASLNACELIAQHGGRIKHSFTSIKAMLVEIPLSRIDELAREDDVVYITPDRKLRGAMAATSKLVGADLLRQQAASKSYTGTTYPAVDGSGVGIAFLDSGASAGNRDFNNASQTASRIVAARDFTASNAPGTDSADRYGHGTTVTGVAAGNGWGSRQSDTNNVKWYASNYGDYTGIAPNANIISIKVIESDGTGSISNVILGIDYAISVKAAYNIRVMNISLGAPVLQSYKTDPLCQAVERAIASGIVVVCSAGNFGHSDVVTGYDTNGKPIYQTVYGGIASPGNDPYVITVGATKNPAQSIET